ncbi:putative lipid kinase YegS [Planctomycetes bacterium CA13]|uniref:Putative lipid kinase YegS n=1 Tax=Novipirellula herctigrandis TaxID=2527986 RepID=A0A5C5ZDH8_9BACT|nr:putative lipid kinase YegS [Planctomycetes bacterium CA13]
MPESRLMRLIINGKSAGDPELRSAVGELRDSGQPIEVRVTWEGGDAARYAAEAVRDGVDVIIAGGGDGTVNEVVGGILSTDKPNSAAVAVLPYGTANDFAAGCSIPIGNPLSALTLAATGNIVPIDVGRANDSYFVNIASGGFGAEVTANTPPELKKALGGTAYSLMGIVTAAKALPHHSRVTLPDGTSKSGDVLVMTAANGRQCGGGQQVAPKAYLNDGLLDFMIVHDVDMQSFGQVLSEILTLGDESNEYVSYAQLPSLRIECDNPFQVNLDGEPVRSKVFEFSVLPKAIRFVLPPNAPLVDLG